MILIQQLSKNSNMSFTFVKCSNCGKGRLCDKITKEKTIPISIPCEENTINSTNGIILKCPKCGAKFLIQTDNKN